MSTEPKWLRDYDIAVGRFDRHYRAFGKEPNDKNKAALLKAIDAYAVAVVKFRSTRDKAHSKVQAATTAAEMSE